MIDPKILDDVGTTNARLKEIFTAEMPEKTDDWSDDQKDAKERDIKTRKWFETLIGDRVLEHVQFSLNNHQIYSAVDLAMDSTPINKATYPLMMYAQGKLDMGKCASSLLAAGQGKYINRNDKGDPIDVQLAKWHEANINLVRSIITRRLAAQSNKYSNLYPHFKYEARGTSPVEKLRADLMSQLGDIIADDYDYKHHEVQVMRDMFMYAHSVDFVRSAWEKDQHWRCIPKDHSLVVEGEKPEFETVITKEGVAFVNPHPSRVFADNNYPLPSINTDTGCEYIGFWDVTRIGDVRDNMKFWNKNKLMFSSQVVDLFTQFGSFFTQYYCMVTPPKGNCFPTDLSGMNDRKNNVGLYAGEERDAACFLTNYYMKLIPKDHGMGDYPYPVWVRFIQAGDNTIVYAEFLPSTPAAVGSYNENDGRQVNISMAHELMGFQDQLTNLFNHLLLCIQADHIKVLIVDIDSASPDQIKAFRQQVKGESNYTGTTVLEVSRSKMNDLGIKPEEIIQLVEVRSVAIDIIFKAIAQLLNMVERLMALSPQEQGQPAPREISATESNLLAGTTESVYGFVSDALDEMRAAKKRILYESYMAHGNPDIELPVVNRYPRHVIEAAGFTITGNSGDELNKQGNARYTVTGTKNLLEHDYIFTSRDGAERPSNTQSANTLVQLLNILQMPQILAQLGKERFFDIINEIFRQSGVLDLKLELEPGEDDSLGTDQVAEQQKQQGDVLKQLTDVVHKNTEDIAGMQQVIAPAQQQMQPQQQPAAPVMPQIMPAPG